MRPLGTGAAAGIAGGIGIALGGGGGTERCAPDDEGRGGGGGADGCLSDGGGGAAAAWRKDGGGGAGALVEPEGGGGAGVGAGGSGATCGFRLGGSGGVCGFRLDGGGGGATLVRATGAESCARLGGAMGGGAPPGAVPRGLLKLGGGGGALDVCGAFATTPESDGIAESFFLLRESKMSRPEPFLSLIGGGSD